MSEIVNYLNIEQDVYCLESTGTIVNISAEFETAVEKVQQAGKEALDNISAQVSHVDEQAAAAENSAIKAENVLNKTVSVIEQEATIAVRDIETQEKSSVQAVLGSETAALSNIQDAVELGKEVLNLRTEEKTTEFNTNAAEKTATYDNNHSEKLEVITEKVSEATVQADNAANSAQQALSSAEQATEAAKNVKSGWSLFDYKWSDHLQEDMSWLSADSFSWYDGNTYNLGYNELVSEKQLVTTSTSETVSGITITFYQTPKGYKIAMPNQESAIVSLYETTGSSWYYILDTANHRFKLPRDSFDKFSNHKTIEVMGTGKSLGLTDGKTNVSFRPATVYYSVATLCTSTKSFNQNVSTSGNANGGIGDDSILGVVKNSNTSGLTGRYNAIKDENKNKYLYFYVGNFSPEAVEQTAGLKAELLNDKADKDLGNVTFNDKIKNDIINLTSIDYSATVAKSLATTYTAEVSGYIYGDFKVDSNTSYRGELYINGNLVSNGNSSAILGINIPFFFKVSKGDTYRLNGTKSTIKFAPHKGN